MKDKILLIVNAKHEASGGKCGTYVVEIQNQLGLTAVEAERIILEMFNNKEVDIREGMQGPMLMKF